MTTKIFVSYASSDRDSISAVTDVLKNQQRLNFHDAVFLDQNDLVAGGNWRDSIRNAIGSADSVVIYWTDAASKSQWVNYEAGMAEALGKEVVIVMPENSNAKLPSILSRAAIIRI